MIIAKEIFVTYINGDIVSMKLVNSTLDNILVFVSLLLIKVSSCYIRIQIDVEVIK